MKPTDFELEEPGGSICTIAAAVEGEAKLVDGQQRKYAHVRVLVAPDSGPSSYRFDWQVLKGTFPFPWMEDACVAGVRLALSEPLPDGRRVVLVRVSVIDGSYHETDSDEESVRTAARLAVHNALSKASLIPL